MNTKYVDLIEQTFDFPQEEFNIEKDQLFFHNINLMELVQKYGSPLKFTYLPKISENIAKARAAIDKKIIFFIIVSGFIFL